MRRADAVTPRHLAYRADTALDKSISNSIYPEGPQGSEVPAAECIE
jgi:hypothetical protein